MWPAYPIDNSAQPSFTDHNCSGIEPNQQGASPMPVHPYSVPTVKLPDGTIVMDSAKIAPALEKLKPEPSLHLDQELQGKLQAILMKAVGPLSAVFMPRLARDVIDEESVANFREVRQKRFGMSLEEVEQTRGGDMAWKAAEPSIMDLKAFLAEHKRDEGPFVLEIGRAHV